MTNRAVVVKTLVVNAAGEVLVLRRSRNDEYSPGRIDLPGGTVERGETSETAAARELFEETGLRVEAGDLRLAYAFTRYEDDKAAVIIRQMFVAKISDQQVRLSHEHDSYAWHAMEEIEALFAGISWGEAIRFVLNHDMLQA